MQRAFKLAEGKLDKDLRTELRRVAEPVRADAERLAVAGIPRVGVPWSQMRVGVTQTSVYVAPKRRGARGNPLRKRPNFAGLLLGRAMVPALERNEPRIVGELEDLLDRVGRTWESV